MMYKVPEYLLKEIKKNLIEIIEELWISSELTPEEFAELKQVKEAQRLIYLISLNYHI